MALGVGVGVTVTVGGDTGAAFEVVAPLRGEPWRGKFGGHGAGGRGMSLSRS